jgi:hypothetical protein
MSLKLQALMLLTASLLAACLGNHKSSGIGGTAPPPPVVNTMAVSVDSGPAAATGQINHAYVTVRVCQPGSTTKCASIDHVQLDTGSTGLRLVQSVLVAAGVTLSAETDAQGQTIEECAFFAGGHTWGPVALADVTMAGEVAAKVPVQILDDTGTGTAPPAPCATNPPLNDVLSLQANGRLGIGVLARDCAACVNAATPPLSNYYYGCTAAGVCTAETIALSAQVTNPVVMFAVDNNGFIVSLPNPVNANGDASLQGELTFGISTQTDNALPATGLTVLGAGANGYFTATYNGGTTALPALIDSGADDYSFDDPTIAACTSPVWTGYYCPAVAPQNVFAVNSGVGVNSAVNTVNFAVAAPDNTFLPNAAAYANLAGGRGSTRFLWGMPFFYGRKIYFGIDQKVTGNYTGPFYAY